MTLPADLHGYTIGHFRILERLGAGGMGDVFLVEDLHLKRRAALKLLRAGENVDRAAHARFQREAEAAARLSHPNVVTIYEVGEHEGVPFIAMEFIDGSPLDTFIKDNDCALTTTLELIIGIARGLEKAHQAGIVHRDLKPGNIMVDHECRPRLVDFGVAQVTQSERLTQTGHTVGTIAYMSPEQLEGRQADERTDLWAVGVMLYELVAGRRPFAGKQLSALMYEILSEDPYPISRLNPDLPADLERICLKCLAKDPKDRYQTCRELISDLSALVEAVSQGTSSPTRSLGGSRRSRRTVIVSSIVVLLLSVTAATVWVVRGGLHRSQKPSSLVVLPFRNLGGHDQDYFAEGLADEVSTKLGRLGNLRVISHTSAMVFRDQTKTSREIGRELGSEFILEGTVRWQKEGSADRIRITPRLIQADDNHEVWSAAYDRTLADVFAIQSDIADNVARSLDVVLFASDTGRFGESPTRNLQAYDYYLQANSYFNRSYLRGDIESAIALYEEALREDSLFAAAWARESLAHSRMYWFGHDQTPERRTKAEVTVRRALAIDPKSPDAHLALGYFYYWGKSDYDSALSAFTSAEALLPNSPEVLESIGYVQRRQGLFDSAMVNIRRATLLDPKNQRTIYELGNTLYRLRRWPEADSLLKVAADLTPAWALPYARRARLQVYARGDVAAARSILEQASAKTSAADLAEERTWVEETAGDYKAALQYAATIEDSVVRNVELGTILKQLNDSTAAVPHFDSARVWLEASIRLEPENASLRRYLGFAYAGLNRAEDAIAQGKEAVGLMPMTRDAFYGGPNTLEGLAEIYARTNHVRDAVSTLAELMAMRAGLITLAYVRIAPEFALLAKDPEFERIGKSIQ